MTFQILALADVKDEILLDVRETNEYAVGCFDSAKNIPLSKLNFTVDVMQGYNKSDKYVLYCMHGMRAKNAAKILHDAGFENIYLLDRGYT